MPDASLSIDGTTVISKTSGNISIDNFNSLSGNLTGATFPAGHIIQVMHGFFDGVKYTNNQNELIDSSLSKTITPKQASSKILIDVHVSMSVDGNKNAGVIIYKDGSELTGATNAYDSSNADRSRYFLGTGYLTSSYNAHYPYVMQTLAGKYMDTPSYTLGNSITYAIHARSRESAQYGINRGISSSQNDTASSGLTSSITVMEIAG